MPGVGYHPKYAERAWQAVLGLISETFLNLGERDGLAGKVSRNGYLPMLVHADCTRARLALADPVVKRNASREGRRPVASA